MTPTDRIQLITELNREFPRHEKIQRALADYQTLAIEANRAKPSESKVTNSRAAYMREHRKKERELIRQAKAAKK